MEWQIYEKEFDIRLYRQMVDMVCRLSEKEDKARQVREMEKYALFAGRADETLEQTYGLRYPGEVLERLGEKIKLEKKQIRALGLALAQTGALQEDSMFVGGQRDSFWKKLLGYADKGDLYLMASRYLVEDGSKRELYQAFLAYPYEGISELLFALSILPEDNAFWEKIKSKLNLALGSKRTVSVYGDVEVYIWLVQKFHWRLKGYRKKDLEALKYIMRLPFSNACSPGAVQDKLAENGYSIPEIYFLNVSLIRRTCLPGVLDAQSITAERMAVKICGLFLSGEEKYPEAVYSLCSCLLAEYERFEIKINGWQGILEGLAPILEIQNVRSYQLVYVYRDSRLLREDWLYIDLTERKWDALYGWLEEDEFIGQVVKTLDNKEYGGTEMRRYLAHYQQITGKDFLDCLWVEKRYCPYTVFGRLERCAIVQPETLLSEFLEEYHLDQEKANRKWEKMAGYLRTYVEKMESEEAYHMLGQLVGEFGVFGSHPLFPVKEMLRKISGVSAWRERFDRMKLTRFFLDARWHREFFCWIEQIVFQEQPEQYIEFLAAVLEDKENLLWFPKEEAKQVYRKLMPFVDGSYHEMKLRKMYEAPEDLEAYQKKKKLAEKRRQMKRRMEEIQERKRKFSVIVAKSRGTAVHFSEINKYLYYNDRREGVPEMVAAYITDVFTKIPMIIYSGKEKKEAMGMIGALYGKGKLDLDTVKKIVNQMEEAEDAGTGHKAS